MEGIGKITYSNKLQIVIYTYKGNYWQLKLSFYVATYSTRTIWCKLNQTKCKSCFIKSCR